MNEKFAKLNDLIQKKHGNLCQISAIKDGETVYESCFNGFAPTDSLNVMSVTKSVFSLLVGIALDRGFIKSVDQRVLDFFPDYTVKRGEKTLQDITVRHLLTMTAPYKYRSEPFTKVYASDDWTETALGLLGGRAGITGEFKYSTVGMQVLAGLLKNASGMATLDFANQCLFAPLGVAARSNTSIESSTAYAAFIFGKEAKERVWVADPQGVNTAGWGLCLSAGELAKIGQLCLDGGMAGDKRVVSEGWIKAMSTPYVQCGERFDHMSYGFLWWLPDAKASVYAAVGDGGNVIYVNPQKKLAVGVTATFKPRVFDRVQLIREQLEPLLEG